MGFRIVTTTKKTGKIKELSRFRADNIVHMQDYMASLGGSGNGLFSSKSDERSPVEFSKGKCYVSEDDVFIQPGDGTMATADLVFALPANGSIQSYAAVIDQLPIAFYYNNFTGINLASEFINERVFPGDNFPLYDPDSPAKKSLRRPQHDTFRPPYHYQTLYLMNRGYGKEIGLADGIQEIYDPYLNRSLFLDHNECKVIMEDLRPKLQWYPSTQPVFYNLGDGIQKQSYLPSALCDKPAIIKLTAERARTKLVGCTLSAHGQKGPDGADGQCGARGENRKHEKGGDKLLHNTIFGSRAAQNGHDGTDGGPGGDGGDGGRGINANRGGDVILILSGTPDNLAVTGSKEFNVNLGSVNSENVIFVDCHGGDGGHGGAGGRGGDGGRGGNGGRGADTFSSGSHGGNGGDGGDGGNGGDGGDAVEGGDAGKGGNCVIQARDPRLLILVEADCLPGVPGSGAPGGEGGRGGLGGVGGRGGRGGPSTSYTSSRGHTSYTPVGDPGENGRGGSRRRSGARGQKSRAGKKAEFGGILWVAYPDNGELQEGATRYDAKVESLGVVRALNVGIFEPNERITVSSILVRNTGELDLPFGAEAFIPSTETVKFEQSRFGIPQGVMKAGCRYTIPFEFHGRIFDLPPPNTPGRQCLKAEFRPRIELLGRPFEKSFYKQELMVQYPIQLCRLVSPENLGRGEIASISVEVNNISRVPYGSCQGSGGKVVLHLHFDARIIPLGVDATSENIPYNVTYDPSLRDSMYVELSEIPPANKVCVNIKIQMESWAELFDRCFWQADVYLREKLIEYNHQPIRVSPVYSPHKEPADVLLVTSEAITRKEFVFWQHILELLDVTVDFWDTTRYCGFSVDKRTNERHQNSWQGRYTSKMILYPHCNLTLLDGLDIAEHFHGEDFNENSLKELGSSLIAFMPQSNSAQQDENAMLKHLAAAGMSIEIQENGYGGKHLTKPNPDKVPPAYAEWEAKFIIKLEKSNPVQSPVLFARDVAIQSVGGLHYSYGYVDIRQIPLLKSSKFLEIDGVGGNMVDMSLDDSNLSTSSTYIPLSSKYGQVFLATLYGIPVSAKLSLMKKESEVDRPPSDLMFYLPNKVVVSREELAMITLAWEVADEVFSFFGELHRMKEIYSDISSNPDAYFENGSIILRGLKLIRKELNKRKSMVKNSKVSQACGEIADLVDKTQKVLLNAEVDSFNLENLLSLEFLQDLSRVHRCHQHYVKEGVWNLVDNQGSLIFSMYR